MNWFISIEESFARLISMLCWINWWNKHVLLELNLTGQNKTIPTKPVTRQKIKNLFFNNCVFIFFFCFKTVVCLCQILCQWWWLKKYREFFLINCLLFNRLLKLHYYLIITNASQIVVEYSKSCRLFYNERISKNWMCKILLHFNRIILYLSSHNF